MKKLLLLPLIVLCFLPELKSQNWIELDIPSGVYPNALDFINLNEGWVIDDYSLMHTNDGGGRNELPAGHLPGAGALVVLVVGEVKRRGELALLRDELDAVLLDEAALPHRGQDSEPLEHPEGLWDQ